MTLFSMQGVNVKCLSLESLCRLLPTVRHNPVELRGEMMTRQHERLHITCALSYPALYPDSTPDCHPGHGKVTFPTGQPRHCNPGSHRPALISFKTVYQLLIAGHAIEVVVTTCDQHQY